MNNKINTIKRYAVFGNPIAHSFSPYIYNQLFQNNNFNAKYTRIAANKPQDISKFIAEFNLSGANITSPAKKSVAKICSSSTNDAKSIGAINTIIQHNQQLIGFNTDWEGVLNSLKEYLTQNDKLNLNINSANILIVGAGAAAAAIIFGLKQFYPTANLAIANRTLKNAQQLAKKFNIKYLDIDTISNDLISKYDIVCFAVPQLAKNDANQSHFISTDFAPKSTLLFFANYTNCQLFDRLKAQGVMLITGTSWLKNQAVPAFEYFYGNDDFCSSFNLDDDIITTNLREFQSRNIYLTGFSGAGKSFLGKKIAKKLSRNIFIDTDNEIEIAAGTPITNLLTEADEEKFRSLETSIIKSNSKLQNAVISLGAGAICNPIIQQIIKATNGFVVYLYSDLNTTLNRFDTNTRPLLQNKTRKEIENFFNWRKYIYFDNADLIVQSNRYTINTMYENFQLLN